MNDDLDLDQLADIGDPFAEEARAPIRPRDRSRTPPGRVAHARPDATAIRGSRSPRRSSTTPRGSLFHERRGPT